MRLSGGGDLSETPAPWVKRPYLIPG